VKSLLVSGIFPPHIGGSGRWLWELYSRLPLDLYTIVAGQHPSAAAFDQTHGLDIHRLPLAFADLGYFDWAGYCRYRSISGEVAKLVRTRSDGAIHCGALLPDAWIGRLVARKFGLPLLVYMHGEETCYANASRQLDWMGRRILRDAAAVIANSENTASILRNRWNVGDDRIHVLNPGVDCAKFAPVERDSAVRHRLGWEDRKVVLTVGRLQERKGQDMMIRALPKILQNVPDVLYAIVGDGDDFARLDGLARGLGVADRVRFHRDLADNDLVRCYQQCDLFALPNRQVGDDIEGFGMVLLEAQACGKPVLAGASGGTAETMRPGETGALVDCTTPHLLAAKIAELLRDSLRRDQMGLAARQWVTSRFDWPVLAAEAGEIHGGILADTRRPHTTRAKASP